VFNYNKHKKYEGLMLHTGGAMHGKFYKKMT